MGQGEAPRKRGEMRKTQSTVLQAGGQVPKAATRCHTEEWARGPRTHMGTCKATLRLRLLHHRGLVISLTTLRSTVALVYSSPRSINLSPTQEQPELEATAR